MLDAVEAVLSPRWNLAFDDSDFYQCDTSKPIVIEATLGDLPQRLLSDATYGLRLRGFTKDGRVVDEPGDEDEEVITIRLSVDSSLEPTWEVVTERHPEGAPIHAREREKLGAVRLGTALDRHLSWGRGSLLARLTDDESAHAAILASAGRIARSSVDTGQLLRLRETATLALALAAPFGVRSVGGLQPGLDPGLTTPGASGLALHDGPVPLRRAGLGTRRLTLLAVQREVAKAGGVVLVDEVEHGLEPFRVRRLLRELLKPTPSAAPTLPSKKTAVPADDTRQVFITSHSAIALTELTASHLRVVRKDGKGVRVLTPTTDAQPILRSAPEAFLSRRVVVCEGKTELGLLRGLDAHWTKTSEPMAVVGIGFADAGGCTKVGKTARVFKSLEYPTAILADSDADLDEPEASLQAAGIEVFRWGGTRATEDQIFEDLPWAGVLAVVKLAIDEHGVDQISAQVSSALKTSLSELSEDPCEWRANHDEAALRTAITTSARSKKSPWFKRVDLAESVGLVVGEHLSAIEGTPLATKIRDLRAWLFSSD